MKLIFAVVVVLTISSSSCCYARFMCPQSIEDFSTREVALWLQSQGYKNASKLLHEHDVDGEALSIVEPKDLVAVGLKLSLAVKVTSCFGTLQTEPDMKQFGTGISQGHITMQEAELFSYNVSSNDAIGVITHFWVTGGPYLCGPQFEPCLTNNRWSNFIDFAVFRYYIDGEDTASIEFTPDLLCGVGPFGSRNSSSSDPPAGGMFGQPQLHAPWHAGFFGKGSANGGWFWDGRVPFQSSIRVTVQLPPIDGYPNVTGMEYFTQVRGTENVPISVAGVTLPSNAKLHLSKMEAAKIDRLEYVDLLNVPKGTKGAILMNTLAVETDSLNFMEGCFHIYSPHDVAFPGLIIATGTEDLYNSAYYFSAGQFATPQAGQTWWTFGLDPQRPNHGQWSAYRTFTSDPQFFYDGIRLQWRNGDSQIEKDGVLVKCLAPSDCDEKTCPPQGNPTNSTVWSYTFYYTF